MELLVAMAIFLIIGGTAFALFNQHASLATRQQNLSAVNIGLRNGMAQLQMDLSGAGQNLLAGIPSAAGIVPTFSLGVVIQNNVPGAAGVKACTPNKSDWSYPISSACYDSLTIYNVKACTTAGGKTSPVLVINDPGASAHENLATSSIMFTDDPANPGDATTLTNDATCFKNGDEVLVIQFATNGTPLTCGNGQSNSYCMTVVTLTQDGAKVGQPAVRLQHNPTGAYGGAAGCPGSSCSDALGIVGNGKFGNALGQGFDNGAYVVNLGSGADSITYAVMANPANTADPQLARCIGASCTSTNSTAITDQVIGFKVGAALWDNAQVNPTDLANYYYDASKYCSDSIVASAGPPPVYVDCTAASPSPLDPYDFTLVRSVRISMIARTAPRTDQTLRGFVNGFDQGPYLVQQASVAVDLRNLTIPDYQN